MKFFFFRSQVTPSRPVEFDEDVDYSREDLSKHYPLLGIPYCHVKGIVEKVDKSLVARIEVKSTLSLSDSRTCKPFDYTLDYLDEFDLLEEMDADAEGYLFPHNRIELDEVVLCSIVTHMPLNAHEEGSVLPPSGEGYGVYDENSLLEKEEKKPSPFDVLEGYDFDEEDE